MGHMSLISEYLLVLSSVVFVGLVLSFLHRRREASRHEAVIDPAKNPDRHLESFDPLVPLTQAAVPPSSGKQPYGGHYVLGAEWAVSCHLGYATNKHLLSIAPTRSGKGRGLVLPNLLDLPDHSVFVIDPKGENALVSASYRRSQGHEVLIFNPYGILADEFKKRGFEQFQSFNPLANLDPDSLNFSADVRTLAEALVYEAEGSGKHFSDAARGLVSFLIKYLVTEPTETNKTFSRLYQIVAGGYDRMAEVKDKDGSGEDGVFAKAAGSPCASVRDGYPRWASGSREVVDVISTAETQLTLFDNPAICRALEGGEFNFEGMKHRKTSVYLILPSEYLITQARYLRLVLLVALSQFMRSERGAHPVLLMLDEFANLGPLQVIENGYGLIAGHGVTLWSFVQNLTQLQNLYPKNWEVFIANSAAVTVSNVNDATTAEYFSRRAAKQEVEKESVGSSNSFSPLQKGGGLNFGGSTNRSLVWDDTLPVANLYGARPDSLFVFMEGVAPPEQLRKVCYDLEEPFKSRADKNPMHKDAAPTGGKRPVESKATPERGPRIRARGPWR